LYDPVKAVRLQAAMTMTAFPRDQLDHRQTKAFDAALKEYQEAMAHVGDFPSGQFNLGNMHMNLGNRGSAEKHYKAAIKIDNLLYPAKINLAMLNNGMGRQEEAERLFREVVREHPDLYEAALSYFKKGTDVFWHLVENTNQAIVISQDERVKYFNPQTLDWTGYTEKDLMTTPSFPSQL
jgi:tetratricopeptide (TPR) repeat protein